MLQISEKPFLIDCELYKARKQIEKKFDVIWPKLKNRNNIKYVLFCYENDTIVEKLLLVDGRIFMAISDWNSSDVQLNTETYTGVYRGVTITFNKSIDSYILSDIECEALLDERYVYLHSKGKYLPGLLSMCTSGNIKEYCWMVSGAILPETFEGVQFTTNEIKQLINGGQVRGISYNVELGLIKEKRKK